VANERLKEAAKLLQIGWPLVFTFASDFSFATVAIVSTVWISSAAVASVALTLHLLFFTIAFFFICLTAITAELNGSGPERTLAH
jgi:Na+-driven multidrug efflux pump